MVGIVLVNYKDYAHKYLALCRDSLRRQTNQNFKVYLVDNAASLESQAYLKSAYPEAIILARPDGNYSAANNLGMRQAISDGCDYLIAANMDTEFDSVWLASLVAALEKNSSAGIAQSLILLHPKIRAGRSDLINSTGNRLHFLFFGFTADYNRSLEEVSLVGYPEISGYASGCSLIIRREVFEAISGYTEELYMYHDDLELSLKVRLLGFKIILAPESIVYHRYEFDRSVLMLYFMERNRRLCFWSFYPTKYLIFLALPFFVMSLGMGLMAIFSGWFKIWLKAAGSVFTPKFWRLRKRLRREYRDLGGARRQLISQKFVGRIEFQEIANPILEYLVNPVFNFYWQLLKKIFKSSPKS